jgi:DNA-binding GntR family transcriptional regulator
MGVNASGGSVAGRVTLADRIYQQLEDEILSGQLEPGSRLRIVHLADRFGTSQAPVREAIRRLTEQGLAVTKPYVGTVLKEPSWNEVEEIYALRAELEAYAVRRILSQPRPRIRSDHPIRHAFADLQRAVRAGAPMGVVDADMEFHQAVCVAANSPVTLELWEMLTKRTRGVRLAFEIKRPDDLSTMSETHRTLLTALEAGDPVAAEREFREHLDDALRRLRALNEKADKQLV